MKIFLQIAAHFILFIFLAPLLPGIINKIKAWVAGRQGPPVLQLYYSLNRLWKKGVVMSSAASPGHILGVGVGWVATLFAAMFLPLGVFESPLAFRGDAILFVYLFALSRFLTTLAALDTGSSFEGMGAAREVSFAILAEAAVITGLLTLGIKTSSVSLSVMLAPSTGAGTTLLAMGLFIVLLAENCRVPFDDPNTHLELTMIHEVMILDHSGPPLAIILHGASLKLFAFSVLLVQAILPFSAWSGHWALVASIGSLLVVAAMVGLTESLIARLAFSRVPMLLTIGFLFCLFALLIACRGGTA